jgi:cysteine-S-conjugate beta-lyase
VTGSVVDQVGAAADGFDFDPTLAWNREKRGTKWAYPGPDVLPAWVADMDFAPCPAVTQAITGLLARGDLGYPDWETAPLAEPFAARMSRLYSWEPDPGHVRQVNDVIQGFEVTTYLGAQAGAAVATLVPSYPPFLRSIPASGRPLVGIPMEPQGDSWAFDPERLDIDVQRHEAQVLLVVNPHNPTGRVLTRSELEALAEVAVRRDLIIVADEIHAELVYDRPHVPMATISSEVAGRTVTLTSASKAFNIAGLRTAVVHIGSEELRRRWDALPSHFFGAPSVVGVEATLAAWRDGDPWLAALRQHLADQRAHLGMRIDDVTGVTCRLPEATYLAWLDCRAARLDGEEAAAFFRRRARVELNAGPDYGPGGDGYARLNFGTGRTILDAVLDRMAAAANAAS